MAEAMKMMKTISGIGAVLWLVGGFLIAPAQDSWHTHRGSNQRTGTTPNASSSAVNFLLSWTYPPMETIRRPTIVDNDTSGATSFTGSWFVPSPDEAAPDAYKEDPNTTEPYRYAICTQDAVRNQPSFTWRSGPLPAGYYRIFVHIPSLPTRLAPVREYARYAQYLITDGTGTTYTVYINQAEGGWIALGNQSYYAMGGASITVRLTNLIVRDSPDYGTVPEPIVVADAVRFEPDYGITKASPVVIRSPLDPTNHLVYIANSNGTIVCMENPTGTAAARVRWVFRVPTEDATGGRVYDDLDTDFTPGPAFFSFNDLDDSYNRNYHAAEVSDDAGNIQRAYWRVRVPTTGNYYIYAWFPSGSDHAREARYVVEYEGGVFDARVDQRTGGRWVRLNQQPLPFRNNQTYEISVLNYSPEDLRAGARRVIADAIRVENAEGGNNAVFSTPAVGRVRVQEGERWVVVFGADNGYVYCIDALGDGQHGTRQGETRLYWAYKPDSSGPFSYASPLIIENENLVVIGNLSGSVYAINTNHDPTQPDGPTNRILQWEYRISNGAFVSTPAYDSSSRTVYIGSVQGGATFGRLYALDPFTDDATQRVRWVYPPLEADPIEPITTTPAVSSGRVYFTTGGLYGGRLYAVNASNGELVWARPALNAPLNTFINFLYSSPLVASVDYQGDGNRIEVVYVATQSGRLIAFNAQTGGLLHVSENLGSAVFSSPVYTQVVDTTQDGVDLGAKPAVVLTTNEGLLLALYADRTTNAFNGKRFEGWRLYSNTAFASPAVLDNWLYISDDSGITYAYNITGVGGAPEETGLGELIPEPGRRGPEADGSDYSELKVTVTTQKDEVDAVLNGSKGPHEVIPEWDKKAFEWGQTFYVILWNFKYGGSRPPAIQFLGPGITKVEYTLAPRQLQEEQSRPPSGYEWFAVQTVTMNPSGRNFWTPGDNYTLQVRAGSGSWTEDLDWTTPQTDRPSQRNPAEETERGDQVQIFLESAETPTTLEVGWAFGIANPLGLAGVGAVGSGVNDGVDEGATERNLVNGNGGKLVHVDFGNGTPVGLGEHGKRVSGGFRVFDRRRGNVSGKLTIRAYANDLRWQGGSTSVINPLPWEILPNRDGGSIDYPDISARNLQMLVERGGDLQRVPITTDSLGNNLFTYIDVPRYQPPSRAGYLSRSFIYVDVNGNGRFDGYETLFTSYANLRRIEAFRELNIAVNVAPDPRLVMEEQTIDFGSLPAGFGFNWGNLFANANDSDFRPDNPIFAPFWKSLTIRNAGNVNLDPVYWGKAVGSPTSSTGFFFSDVVSPFLGMPAWTTVHTTLDPRFWPQENPYYRPTGSQPTALVQKPQVGDFAPTVLTIPAIPPRRDPTSSPPPVVKPQIAVSIPPFQPMGVYSRVFAPYVRQNTSTPGIVDTDDILGSPPVRLVVRVRESQLTGSTNRGVKPMIDPVPAPNSPGVSNITPAAFRDPSTGNLHLYWSSNRGDGKAFFLYRATLQWNARNTLQNGVRATNGWVPASDNQWWSGPFGPYPDDTSGSLFVSAIGLGRTLTDEERATIRHAHPAVYASGNRAWLFWNAEAVIDNRPYSLLLMAEINPRTGELGSPVVVPVDPAVPRSRPSITGVTGVGHFLVYTASPAGRKEVYYLFSQGEGFVNFQRERKLPISGVIRSIESVSAQAYRVALAPNSNQFVTLVEVVITGTAGERNEPEVLLQRYLIDGRRRLLVPLDDRNAERRLGAIQERLLPLVVEEIAQKEPDQNVWRVRHLDWARLGNVWNQDPSQSLDLDIKVNGVSVIRSLQDATQYQEPVENADTGLLQFQYVASTGSGRAHLGIITVDTRNGTIRFVGQAPGLRDIVTVTYRPRVYRLTPFASGEVGSYTQVLTILQRTMNPRFDFNNPATSMVRSGELNGVCMSSDRPSVDRHWVLFRRTDPTRNVGSFFFKTLRPGVRLGAPIATDRGRLPLANTRQLSFGANHAYVQLTANNPADSQLHFYEYDPVRGHVYFSTEDLGKEVEVGFLTFVRDPNTGAVRGVETRTVVQTIRWIDEGNLPGESPEYTSAVPIDLPTNELYLWAMPNLELRAPGNPLSNIYGSLDESLLLFWSSTRNGLPDIYAGAIQPRFYALPFDPDSD